MWVILDMLSYRWSSFRLQFISHYGVRNARWASCVVRWTFATFAGGHWFWREAEKEGNTANSLTKSVCFVFRGILTCSLMAVYPLFGLYRSYVVILGGDENSASDRLKEHDCNWLIAYVCSHVTTEWPGLVRELQRQHVLLRYFKTLSIGPVWGSNPRPPARQSSALPTELTRQR